MDRFDAALDGKPVRGNHLTLGLTGITTERTVPKDGIKSAIGASESSDAAAGYCCIECGDWEVCCEPASGWCCGLECSSGGSCEACNAQ